MSSATRYIRPLVRRLHAYVPGEQPKIEGLVKLNTNENPYPPSPKVVQAIHAVLEQGLAKYPDPFANSFRRRAAEVLGVEPDWILCGNGSDDLLAAAGVSDGDDIDALVLGQPALARSRNASSSSAADAAAWGGGGGDWRCGDPEQSNKSTRCECGGVEQQLHRGA